MLNIRFASAMLFSLLVVSPCAAQHLADIQPGARVRASGDRATNDGVRRFSMIGIVTAIDSEQIILRPKLGLAAEDTVHLLGVRRLDLYQGMRSRRSMIATGAALGAVIGVAAWYIARQTVRPETINKLVDGPGGVQSRSVPGPDAPIIHQLRNGIPLEIGVGALIGALIGPEKWLPISVPQSVFSQPK